MGMINCDTEGLTNKVLPPLNSGCDDLDSAENIISLVSRLYELKLIFNTNKGVTNA